MFRGGVGVLDRRRSSTRISATTRSSVVGGGREGGREWLKVAHFGECSEF